MNKVFFCLFVLLLSISNFDCSKDKNSNTTGGGTLNVDCSTVTNKAFGADVNPIIQNVCNTAGCHATGSNNGVGPLTNYTQVFNARSNIRSAISLGSMPQGSTLTIAQRSSIICWIDSGAPNN